MKRGQSPFANCHPGRPAHSHSLCRECHDLPIHVRRRHFELRDHFNLTKEEYDQILSDQNGACAICEEPFKGETPHVDHDHRMLDMHEAVRGLLCQRCNISLGGFRDNPANLRAAADYVEAGT